MSTIQIRDVPEAVHRVYKARAAAAGQSLQEYLRAELIEGARLRAPGEIAAEIEAEMSAEAAAGYAAVSATAFVRDDRDAR
ncbi:MAG TPA: hypothetical protein VML96_04000 [Egibacteraceae bacterium]|nr:hypothetical protein [Egibacteraceae bacterium]